VDDALSQWRSTPTLYPPSSSVSVNSLLAIGGESRCLEAWESGEEGLEDRRGRSKGEQWEWFSISDVPRTWITSMNSSFLLEISRFPQISNDPERAMSGLSR
jgi:hypothetical protein